MKHTVGKSVLSFILVLGALLFACPISVLATETDFQTIDNGDISTFTGFETDEHLSYVYYYQGTEPWVASEFSNGVRPMTKSTNNFENEAYIVGDVPGEDGSTWNYNNVYASANGIYAPQYHFSPGLAFEAPLTGTFRFTIQYMIPNENHRIVVAKSSVPLQGGEYLGCSGIYGGAVGTLIEKEIDIDLTAGEKAYFFVDNLNNGYETQFHIRTVQYTQSAEDPNATEWDWGDIQDALGFVTDSRFGYVYFYQGTDPNCTATAGVREMVVGTNALNQSGVYICSESNHAFAGANSAFAPQYHFSPGLSFQAPFTGTIQFTLQVNFGHAEHNVVVGRESVGLAYNGNLYTGCVDRLFAKADELNTTQEWTVSVDVTEGENVYFLMDHLSNGFISQMHVKSAKYIIGDLSKQNTTLLGVQETEISDGKFDICLLSATKDAQYSEMGFKYTIKSVRTSDGTLLSESEEITVTVDALLDTFTVFDRSSGTSYDRKMPQNTKTMRATVDGLAADDVTVEITVYSYTKLRNIVSADTACVIKYVNGVFDSIVNVQ